MIFQLVGLNIDDITGDISIGGTDFLAYVFTEPLIEVSNSELKTFMFNTESKLDKKTYETAIFFCMRTSSLYVNVMNWHRFHNGVPLGTDASNHTVLLAGVETEINKKKPDRAFAKYTKSTFNGASLWLYSVLIFRTSRDQHVRADRLRKVTSLHSRMLYPDAISKDITHLGQLRSYFMSGYKSQTDHGKYKGYLSDTGKIMFYVIIAGDTISARCLSYAYTPKCSTPETDKPEAVTEIDGKVYIYGYNITPINTAGILENTVNNVLEHRQLNTVMINSDGDTFQAGGTSWCGYGWSSNKILSPNILKFKTHNTFATYIKTKYTDGSKISLRRLSSSDFYVDKNCKILIGVRSPLTTGVDAMQMDTRFFNEKNPYTTIYQKHSVYMDINNDSPEIYVIEDVCSFKSFIKEHGEALFCPKYIAGLMLVPTYAENVCSYPSRNTTYNGAEFLTDTKLWIPNTNQNKLLEHFQEVAVYCSDNTIMGEFAVSIYNDTKNIHKVATDPSMSLSTSIAFDKTNFTPKLPTGDGERNTYMTKGSKNTNNLFDGPKLNEENIVKGYLKPTTKNPPKDISTIEFFAPVAYLKITI